MIYILIPVLVVLVVMVVVSLFRGLNAFRKSLDQEQVRDAGSGGSEMQLMQNRMMWSRIRYQALAVIVVAIMLAVSR